MTGRRRVPTSTQIIVALAACLVLALLAAAPHIGGGSAGSTSGDVQLVPDARTCFPLPRWQAAPGRRPCARIARVWEDGSVRVVVSDASGAERFTFGYGAADR